jgi:pyrroloquinoline quinone (PQQ) biosynthesis protein C
MSTIRLESVEQSASAAELLALDENAPHMRLAAHPVWQAALAGELPMARLRTLATRFYPVVAGPGRYAFAGKVSQIGREDGAKLFEALYEATHEKRADADQGWRRLAEALGVSVRALDGEAANPCAEAEDFLDTIRLHSVRGTAHEAAAVAWAVERQLPRLWAAFADSLTRHYKLKKPAVDWLLYEAARADKVEGFIAELVSRYILGAAPDVVYDARRAAREAAWAWTALSETV